MTSRRLLRGTWSEFREDLDHDPRICREASTEVWLSRYALRDGVGFLSLVVLSFLTACGGGSQSSPPPPPPPPQNASYALNAGALSPSPMIAGQSSSATVTITPSNGYTGTVTLSCLDAGGSAAPSCAFSQNPLTVTATTAVTSTLTLSSSISAPGGTYTVTVSADDAKSKGPTNGSQTLNLITAGVIQHVVIIFQENRSPDNLFQDPVLISRGADIAGSGVNSLGQTIPLSPIDLGSKGKNPQNYDLGHTHGDFLSMYDNGKMDGADLIICFGATCPPNGHPNPQFMYVTASDVQPYFTLAEQFTFADRMFQTNQGPTFPAHQFILAGTSAPTATSTLFASENPSLVPYGCIGPPTELEVVIDANGNHPHAEYPCFEHATMTDLLDEAGVSWRYYAPTAGGIGTAPTAINHICQAQTVNGSLACTGPDWTGGVVIPETQVLQDIANNQLPQVSWIIPSGFHSDHAGDNDGSGPSWVSSIVNAIGNSPYWANTAIFVTWDDWGGWYDHVAPKVINDGVSWGSGYVYGFRVPLIVVSPYAKASYISHTTHDFGSILKFIENTYNLPSLGYADAQADDLSDCFVFTQSPITFQSVAAPLRPNFFLEDTREPIDPDTD